MSSIDLGLDTFGDVTVDRKAHPPEVVPAAIATPTQRIRLGTAAPAVEAGA